MALAFDVAGNSPINTFGVVSVATGAFTIAATANRVAVLFLSHGGNGATSIASNCSGVAGALVANSDSGAAQATRSLLHVVINPASGASKTASFTWTTSEDAIMGALVYNGADQTNGVNNGKTTNAATGAVSVAMTAGAAGDLSVVGLSDTNTPAGATQTTRITNKDNGSTVLTMTEGATGATHGWNDAFSAYTTSGCNVIAAATGITFDAAANSGDIAAANTFSGNASWSGTNRFLAVDVSLLGVGVNVTSMTYGGAACTFIGSRSTITALGSVECWRICSSDAGAPGTGANTLVVNLSGSVEFAVEWTSYTSVDQTVPTEAFNSAQATNVGAADAAVDITTVTNNCWVHGAVVASDTSITANQTSRNNIAGTLGAGGNEDNNAAKTPAGAVTMSYTNVAALATWAIAGYAIRPVGSVDVSAWYARRASRILGTGMLLS